MKIIIKDLRTNKMKEITSETAHMPRIGESIFLGYTPASKVTSIIHHYEERLILIICNGDEQ